MEVAVDEGLAACHSESTDDELWLSNSRAKLVYTWRLEELKLRSIGSDVKASNAKRNSAAGRGWHV